MKPTKKEKKKIKEQIELWRGRLFLHEWFLSVGYSDDEKYQGPFSVSAEVFTNVVYLKAEVTIFPNFFTLDDNEKERCLVHELCHCLTQESWNTSQDLGNGKLIHFDTIRDRIETLTQRISNVAFNGYK